jgi:EpsI family protein
VKKDVPLSRALSNIKGWTQGEAVPLSPQIVEALELDDYVNQSYFNGQERVFLYIGYYFTTKKVGAAHDPLVCFPGQGWVVSDRQKGELSLNRNPTASISYTTMIVQRGEERQLILYWFQSYDQASADTFSQKVASLWKKLRHQGQDNAFVRISTPVADRLLSESRQTALSFVRTFYPGFLDYVKGGKPIVRP